MIPTIKGTSAGREHRSKFLHECFVPARGGHAYGKDIVLLIEDHPSKDWSTQSQRIVELLARDISLYACSRDEIMNSEINAT